MALLEVENVTKRFGGLIALNNVSFTLEKGNILGLIGPNGSGKTTLFNVICGFQKAESGRIRINDFDITRLPPYRICRAGIAMTFQLVRSFNRMTALQNVMAGSAYGRRPASTMPEVRQEAKEILSFTGLSKYRETEAGTLSLIDRKKLEIARALATKPILILLDEMMAGLNPRESEEAMRLLQKIKDLGITLIIVEHVMKVVLGISDRVIVLSTGGKIAEGCPKDIISNRQVIQAYLGEEYSASD